jgi:hypothetical protein
MIVSALLLLNDSCDIFLMGIVNFIQSQTFMSQVFVMVRGLDQGSQTQIQQGAKTGCTKSPRGQFKASMALRARMWKNVSYF